MDGDVKEYGSVIAILQRYLFDMYLFFCSFIFVLSASNSSLEALGCFYLIMSTFCTLV